MATAPFSPDGVIFLKSFVGSLNGEGHWITFSQRISHHIGGVDIMSRLVFFNAF